MFMGGDFTKLSYSKRRSAWALKVQPTMRTYGLGYRQVQVLNFIRAQIQLIGSAPSYREICDEFGMDRGNLSKMITSFQRRGLIAMAGAGRVRQVGRFKGEQKGIGRIRLA